MMPEHQLKVDELVKMISSTLAIECHNLYNSGAVDVSDYDPDKYVLAKALITAALHRVKDNYAFYGDEDFKTAFDALVLV